MNDGPDHPHHADGSTFLSKNRIEALTDGIYAVAMTLLVIELKLPDGHGVESHAQLVDALTGLLPKAFAWIISFFVLAIFWMAHHRLFQMVRHVDNKLLWRNLIQLALISLVPFSASMIGEHSATLEAHYIYNSNMLLLALTSLWQVHYVHRHPEMQSQRLTPGRYHAALIRIGGLACAAIAAMILAILTERMPYFANYIYLVMWPIGIFSRRVAARESPAVAHSNP